MFSTAPFSCYNSLFSDLLFSKEIYAPPALSEVTTTWNWSSARPICCANCNSSRASSSARTRFRFSPTCCSKPNGDEVKLLATDLEVGLRSRCAGDGVEERIADAAGEEALRDRQGAARDRRPDRGGQGRRQGRRGSVRLADADAAARGFSDAAGGDGQRSARRCRATSLRQMVVEDAVRDHRRGHALLPQRRAVPAAARLDGPGGDRRPSAGARHRAARSGEGQGRQGRRATRSAVILPRKTLLELGRLLAEGEGDILYERGENHLFFTSAAGC